MKLICKIAILEGYALYSSGIKSLLAGLQGMEVIAEGVNIESLAVQLHNKSPDILLIDMLHCNNSKLITIRKTKKYFPDIPLLLITSDEHSKCLANYIAQGAYGFVFINEGPKALLDSINRLCDGKMSFRKNSYPPEKSPAISQTNNHVLSPREVDVLKLFCNGLTYKEIGEKLFISPRTVESHKKNILAKLNINSTAEMVKYASRNGFLSD